MKKHCILFNSFFIQFLCIENLRAVIRSLQDVFGFSKHELFIPHDLYNMTNFRQVIIFCALI